MAREFQALNRITAEQLQRAVLVAGFDAARLELLSSPTMLSPTLARYSWTDLGISGIKLLSIPSQALRHRSRRRSRNDRTRSSMRPRSRASIASAARGGNRILDSGPVRVTSAGVAALAVIRAGA